MFLLKTPTPRSRDLSTHHSLHSQTSRTLLIPPGDYLPHVRFAALFAFGEPSNNGDNRIRTGDPLLAKQVLYQLSYVPGDSRPFSEQRLKPDSFLVGQGGLEPPTPRLSSVCSNQLSY
jgi:hypothetical protein